MYDRTYALFAFLGLMILPASFILGFRHDPSAPAGNILFDFLLYLAYILVHFAMTTAPFKRLAYGNPGGTPHERRVYVTVSIVTWLLVYWLHRPIPGFAFTSPAWVEFLGLCCVLLSMVAFFEYATFEMLAMLVAVPGAELSHTTGAETPLMTDGPYAEVRHPMYRAFFFLALSSLLMHPNAGQLLFAVMVWLSFALFIPIEERRLLRARGTEYAAYMERVRFRVFHGIW